MPVLDKIKIKADFFWGSFLRGAPSQTAWVWRGCEDIFTKGHSLSLSTNESQRFM